MKSLAERVVVLEIESQDNKGHIMEIREEMKSLNNKATVILSSIVLTLIGVLIDLLTTK